MNDRETIHISLGSTANAVSAHLLNLEGLAATSASCEASITHGIQNDVYVPRCFFVEEGQALTFADLQEQEYPEQPQLPPHQQAAHDLAYSKYSRYRVPSSARKKESWFASSSCNDRHVDWGDDSEEGEDGKDNDEEVRWKGLDESDKENSPPPPSPDWTDIFAPPLPSSYQCRLPLVPQSYLVDTWDTYTMGHIHLREWREDTLLEQLRKLLENCDYVQGVSIMTQGHGIYAGLTTVLLQELEDECRTAGRLVYSVTNPPLNQQEKISLVDTWQPARAHRVRQSIEQGLSTLDLAQSSHLMLPLFLEEHLTTFESTSRIAMALETTTLPYRRAQGGRMDGTHYYHEGPRLSFGEFLASLQIAPRYKLLELDFAVVHDLSFLIPGTSTERSQQVGRQSRQLQVLPGEWTEHILTSMSPNDGSKWSLHRHFSLASAIRLASSDPLSTDEGLSCIMEGLGIRYRPETTLGLVMDQSMDNLVSGGYAAGAYWKTDPRDSLLSVLSNSSRSYSYAKEIADNMKDALSFRLRDYHSRDMMNGVLPEAEDCTEAMEYCLGLRDTYHPPENSGLGEDDEGGYFDDGLA